MKWWEGENKTKPLSFLAQGLAWTLRAVVTITGHCYHDQLLHLLSLKVLSSSHQGAPGARLEKDQSKRWQSWTSRSSAFSPICSHPILCLEQEQTTLHPPASRLLTSSSQPQEAQTKRRQLEKSSGAKVPNLSTASLCPVWSNIAVVSFVSLGHRDGAEVRGGSSE